MKRVLYNTCFVDPWAKVALRMKELYQWEPVYWIGYGRDNSQNIIPSIMPDTIFQDANHAWKCVFPPEVESKFAESYLDVDFLRECAPYQLEAFTMMNRLDFDGRSFNNIERERHFLNLFKYWTSCISSLHIDFVISPVIPHRVYDFVLYLVCKKMNIPFISFQFSMVPGITYAIRDLSSIGNAFMDDYLKFLKQEDISFNDLPVAIYKNYQKILSDYSTAIPNFMLKNNKNDQKYSHFYNWVFLFISRKIKLVKNKRSESVGEANIYKNKKQTFEKSHYSLLDFMSLWPKMISYKKKLKKYYSTITTTPDFNSKYIFVALHYQPEATSSPSGGIFVNQQLCIETLLKNTPNDVLIYVKEHPAQFMSQFLGHTSRMKTFYDDLLKNPRVKFMSLNADPYQLLKHSMAVSTITGTIGWEAMCNQKPVISFGVFWYENYSGVIRITDSESARRIMPFINEFRYDEHNLLAYLLAFAKNTIRAYQYEGYNNSAKIPEEECVENICNYLISL